jgi:UDP-N-acetylglucosamine 1-carboxyvinyltransferase
VEYLEIKGGNPLKGEVRIQGSKNAALPILSAVILHRGTTVLRNCPKIIDVVYMLEILKDFGCRVSWEKEELVIDASKLLDCQVAECYGRQMRSSIMLLGSLLGRMKEACVSYPGGCVIGARPIDLHLAALERLGAVFTEEPAGLKAVCRQPVGAAVSLPFPSVGATENVILLASLAEGTTILENAAREPEIVELCRFLNCMGGSVRGAGTSRLVITGVKELHDTEFTIMPDRIVAGTYMLMTAAAGGEVLLRDAPLEQLECVRRVLEQMGVKQEHGEHGIRISCGGRPRCIEELSTSPYPGFPTDLQSPLLAALSAARGSSCVRETIFEARFKIVEELCRMGADIRIEGEKAVIQGVPRLYGTDLTARELRGGAALVLAAAAAEGTSRIYQYHYIARGYENIIRDLQSLGVVVRYLRS